MLQEYSLEQNKVLEIKAKIFFGVVWNTSVNVTWCINKH